MNRDTQRAKAEAFRAMHDRSRILVLPNAWDAMSARVIEEAGARAIATTSAGVAFSVGYPDGEAIPRDEMIAAIARIARVVTLPVSADIESGFANDTRELAETIRRVIDAGAVGINLEDQVHDGSRSLYDLDVAVARVRAAREAAEATGVPLVINARTDVYLLGVGEPETRFEHAVRRANAYRKAGADCSVRPGGGQPRRHRATRARAGRTPQPAVNSRPPDHPRTRAPRRRTRERWRAADSGRHVGTEKVGNGTAQQRYLRTAARRCDWISRREPLDGRPSKLASSCVRNGERVTGFHHERTFM
jgi:2-methylisocitrate lyase-like PEP mutase family enzyme